MTAPAERADLDPPPGLWSRIVARISSWLLPASGALAHPEELKSILIVRTDDRVGNALLTIPLARALATLLPNTRVDLLLEARRAPLAEGLPGLHVVRFAKKDAFRNPLRFLSFLLSLRRAGYDAALDAAHWHAFSLTSALLARFASKRVVIGPARGATCLYTHTVPLPAPHTHDVAAKLALLSGLGLAPPAPPPLETVLGASASSQASAKKLLEPLHLERFALLNPGSRKADHRLEPEAYARIALALHRKHGLRSLLTWGPGEEALVAEVHARAPEASVIAPATNLDQLAALLRVCAVAITNDTGPMHLAVACGARVIALFASEDGARWAHPGPNFTGIRTRECKGVDELAEQVASAAVK